MSSGVTCKGEGHRSSWRVTVYKAHHSAFNGYRRTPSDYSEMTCTLDGHRWRTKAAYVEEIFRTQEVKR